MSTVNLRLWDALTNQLWGQIRGQSIVHEHRTGL